MIIKMYLWPFKIAFHVTMVLGVPVDSDRSELQGSVVGQ